MSPYRRSRAPMSMAQMSIATRPSFEELSMQLSMRRLVLTFCVWAVASLAAAQTTAIRAGRLIDVEAGTALTNQIVLVEAGRITAIGPAVKIPDGATVVDLSTHTVLPGLFDAHTHLCMTVQPGRDAKSYYYTTLNDPDSMRAVQGVVNARSVLESGFTTVRDVGNEGNYACSSVSRAIEQRLISGPTLMTAGRIIAPYGGQFHLQPDKRTLGEPEYFFADTRDEMVKAIRENIHYGAGVIKIVVDDQRYIYSVDDIRFMIDEAGRAGLKLAAHAWTHAGARNAAEAGVASIEHGFTMTDDDLETAKRHNVALVGTEFLALDSSAEERAKWIDRLKRAHRIGVTLVYGTDVIAGVEGQTRGSLTASGVDPWIEAGVPNAKLLQAMTVNAARLLGVEKDRGALRVGLAADIIATPANPLDDPSTLKRVAFVMKDGVVVKPLTRTP
jgi:imidazolonepropionase-like amidohydrolase